MTEGETMTRRNWKAEATDLQERIKAALAILVPLSLTKPAWDEVDQMIDILTDNHEACWLST